jgi:hypothetical protein
VCVCVESGFPSPRPNCSCRAEHPSIKASNFFLHLEIVVMSCSGMCCTGTKAVAARSRCSSENSSWSLCNRHKSTTQCSHLTCRLRYVVCSGQRSSQ